MTEQENKPIINIDGTDYDLESLSEQAKYNITQIQELNNEETRLRMALDRVSAARKTFFDNLKNELTEEATQLAG